MTETERADLDRRLRIRRRNLERLEAEAAEVEASEAPPAVLSRLQAQIRVEREEIRLLEEQALDHIRHPNAGEKPRPEQRGSVIPRLLVRVALALIVTAALFFMVQAVLRLLPHVPETRTTLGAPPTYTLSPTYTPGPATPTGLPAVTEAATTTSAITVTSGITATPDVTLPLTTTTMVSPLAPNSTPTTSAAEPTPTIAPTTALTGTFATVHDDPLNLRGGPGTTYPVKRRLSQGDQLRVTGRTTAADWLAVVTVDGESGWVKTDYLTVTVSTDTIPVAEATGAGG